MILTSNKNLRDVFKVAEKIGWSFYNGGKHIKAKHLNGKLVIISRTPQDGRALQNIKKDLGI